MKCKTIKGYGVKKDGSKGRPIYGPKVKFNTLYEAQIEAIKQNALPKVFIKREAYKCPECGSFHIGKTTTMIQGKKAKPKKDRFRSLNLRIVGSIDLGQFEKKPNSQSKDLKAKLEIKKKAKEIRREAIKNMIEAKERQTGMEKYGEMAMLDGVWRFEFKSKILKVITPEKVRHILLTKLFNERAIRLYENNGNMLSKQVVRNYLKDNFDKLI